MSTSPDQSTPQTEWGRAEGARFRSKAATTGLVALVTLRELARRRGALALATLLPLTFYLDALAYEDLWALISAWRTSGAGVLVVTHLLRDVDLVDRVIELPAPQEDASRTVLRMPRRVQRKESA